MKRDMELIRELLLRIEAEHDTRSISGFTTDEIKYHKSLLIESALAEGVVLPNHSSSSGIPADVHIRKLTWDGHNFIDAITSDSNWQTVKELIRESGKQITLETVKAAILKLFGL